MHAFGRNVAIAAGAAIVAILLAGCDGPPATGTTSVRPPAAATASSAPAAPSNDSSPSAIESSPIVFAFDCTSRSGSEREYTTYSAVWASHSTDCSAVRISGTLPSEQQEAAVRAAGGTVSLRRIAALCAVTDGGPWAAAITSEQEAELGRALLTYCPGHPRRERLRAAIARYER